ncbi:hypothetical protein JAAARDRAFT_147470 [Jaapia argillacea MUCL 33604]|uniref:Major facilitator superfamily (MFS) profile domain-containing protein n=1 Tax=Jaapia argillacea MUCL 33604 TaxID=933084 RepID=A0A067Q8C5_9AGAM|nr:hypothetical protein JAAARDRAFT_147470 [Jaapia argillacea MUCL 33604]
MTTPRESLSDGTLQDHDREAAPSAPSVRDQETSKETQTVPIHTTEKPYSIFTRREKWIIVTLASVAGIFSPFTANIYFPVIPVIATAFHKSVELINLTVTIYMVMQGVSPMLWGTVSDRYGRRPIFLACLLILSLSCVGLALVPTNAYWLLMLLRAVQAAGSASTIAVGAGVIGDVATPAERGGFFGVYNIGPMVGPTLGPIVGGLLADHLGWRSIFWFMCISSGVCFVFMFIFFPETLRVLVGDGSIPPPKLYRPVVVLTGRNQRAPSSEDKPPPKRLQNPLRLLTYPEILIPLLFVGVVFAVLYGFMATMSALFKQTYPYLTETDLGLCFLTIGGGMLFGGVVSGKLLDKDYQRVKRRLIEQAKADPERKTPVEDIEKSDNFPIEFARLRWLPLCMLLLIACCLGYGWSLQKRAPIAVPLIINLLVGLIASALMAPTSTLLVDLAPGQSSSVTACNNIVRCAFGAALVSIVDLIINAIGTGWTYVVFAGMIALITPILYLEMKMGPVWRARRRAREEKRVASSP